ncbi:MAG: hypothetical protein HGA81_08465, partial [Chlorobium limicola]|nr:hypothetical protein [Chlorobium limicola]
MKNKILRIPVLAGCIGSVLIPASAMAEPGYYETGEVVVTATLSETPVSQIPAAIEVISKEDITESGAKTFADVLTE